MKSKPDVLTVLMIVFSLGLAATVLAMGNEDDDRSQPVSELQSGILIQD